MRLQPVGGSALPRAGRHRPRRTPSKTRWTRIATRGLGTVAIAVMLFATALIAAGRLLAVSVDARSDARSVVGMTQQPRGLSLVSLPDSGMPVALPVPLQFASLSDDGTLSDAPETVSVSAAYPAPSGTLRDFTSDQIFTGSIHKFTTRFDAINAAATERMRMPARLQDFAMPRARPQLAALPPANDLGITPDGEDASPAKTAIYDINARTVYMPNGEKLEAHSGLGQFMDDPKHVRLRMRGVTPPNTYKLTMREALFHGVEAIRMTPTDKDAMFGRNGILAHSYMLGPSGQSNGCVSFKDYPKFLAAFKRGEVERMVVVFRLEKPPSFFARRPVKSASAAN